jgi:hypothetical protein
MTEKIKFKFPGWTDFLIYAGAIANIALWIRAGLMVESNNAWGLISSTALGIVMSFGPVQIIQKWATLSPTLERKKRGQTETESRPNPRYWMAVSAFGLIMASEALLLGPVVVAMMTARSLAEVLGTLVSAWAAGRVLVSAVALAGLSAVLGTAAKVERTPSAGSDTTSENSGGQPAQSGKKTADQQIRCAHDGAGCERVFNVNDYGSLKAAQNAANAHSRKCAYKPIAVDIGVRK